MNLVRVIGVCISILFVFIGNIGINVFTHSCEEDGTFHSFILNRNDHCKEKQTIKADCCQKEAVKEGCCKDEVKVYHVKFDYFHSDAIQVPFLFVFDQHPYFAYCEFIGSPTEVQTHSPRPPPKIRSGRTILVTNQVFRI